MIPVRFPLSGEQWKGKDPAFCNLTSRKTPAQPQNLEISMTWAHEQGMLVTTEARMIRCVTWEHYAVPSGGLSLSVEHILYVPVCVYVFVCVCACNSSPKGNSFLGPWSLRSNVCCYLKEVAFVRSNTRDNPELLVLCMDSEWKTGDFTNSKASRDHHNHPILLTKVSVTPWWGGEQLCWWGQRPSLLKKEMRPVFLCIKWWQIL